MSTSPLPLWVSKVVTRTLPILPVRPKPRWTTRRCRGPPTVNVRGVGDARPSSSPGRGPSRHRKRHELSVPPLVARASETRSVHTPFGFSPSKAARASSGAGSRHDRVRVRMVRRQAGVRGVRRLAVRGRVASHTVSVEHVASVRHCRCQGHDRPAGDVRSRRDRRGRVGVAVVTRRFAGRPPRPERSRRADDRGRSGSSPVRSRRRSPSSPCTRKPSHKRRLPPTYVGRFAEALESAHELASFAAWKQLAPTTSHPCTGCRRRSPPRRRTRIRTGVHVHGLPSLHGSYCPERSRSPRPGCTCRPCKHGVGARRVFAV